MEGNSGFEDRRKTGVHRVRATNGNGGEFDVYTATASRVKVWAGAIIAVLTVVGMVFAATRIGVGIEVHDAIEAECEPGMVIDRAIDAKADEFLEEVQGVIQDDMDDWDNKFKEQAVQMQEQNERGIRLEERQTAIQRKMDTDKAELIREIRRAGGDG